MSGRNSAYSPLAQSNSDSEVSSEELHADEESTVINRISKSQNVAFEKIFINQNQNSVNYKLLDVDKEVQATFVKFQPTSDNILKIKPNDKTEVFSISRKVCFVLSLLLCVLTTIIFIWFLPCNERACFFAASRSKIILWEHTLEDLELFGPASLFSNAFDSSQILVFLTKNIFVDVKNKSEKEYNLITFEGENGVKKWNLTLNKEPQDLDCNMLDLTLDGINDCLIMGENFLKAINSVSGTEIWDFYNSKTKEIVPHVIDFPIVIYDVNGDGISDLVTSCSFYQVKHLEYVNTKNQNYLVILSGKTGEIINTPKQMKNCLNIHNVTIKNNSISFTCCTSGKEYQETLSLSALLETLNNSLNKKVVLTKWNYNYEHPKESSTISINGFRVIIDNQGQCPGNCQVAVDIKDEKNEKKNSINNTVYTYNDRNAYCILPIIFKGKSLTIIVLKFWKWESKKSFNEENKNDIFKKGAVMFKYAKSNEFKSSDNLYREMLTENVSNFKRHKRGTGSGLIEDIRHLNDTLFYDSVYLHVVNEMIVSITFNKSHPLVKNISQSKILQICRSQKCEPDIQNLKRSLLIADVNGDGREELISFSSRFKHENGNGESHNSIHSWRLQSVIRVATL